MKGGSRRFHVKCWELNAVTTRDINRMPSVSTRIDFPWEATVFSTIDAGSRYWQVDINSRSRYMMVFPSHHSLYRFMYIPVGLDNAPRTLQRTTGVTISASKCQHALIYLHTIVVFSCPAAEHIGYVKHVLTILRVAEVTLS